MCFVDWVFWENYGSIVFRIVGVLWIGSFLEQWCCSFTEMVNSHQLQGQRKTFKISWIDWISPMNQVCVQDDYQKTVTRHRWEIILWRKQICENMRIADIAALVASIVIWLTSLINTVVIWLNAAPFTVICKKSPFPPHTEAFFKGVNER